MSALAEEWAGYRQEPHAAANRHSHHVAEVFADFAAGDRARAIEPADQGGQPRADQASFAEFFGKLHAVRLAAIGAVLDQGTMLCDRHRCHRQFDLLKDSGRLVGVLQPTAAAGTTIKPPVPRLVDLVFAECFPLVSRMPPAEAPFLRFLGRPGFFCFFGRFDDISGGRFGGVGRTFARCRQFRLRLGQGHFQLRDPGIASCTLRPLIPLLCHLGCTSRTGPTALHYDQFEIRERIPYARWNG